MDALSPELLKEKEVIEKAGKLHWLHWLVVVLSLFLTFMAWHISKKTIDEKVEIQFEEQARQAIELVTERLQKYEDGLWGGVAAIQANGGDISYEKWKTYYSSLRIDEKYPGISGIGVIHYVRPEDLQSYLLKQRKDRPDYKIYPAHNKKEFWPITYIEPVENNLKAVGLDMAHETNRHTAGIKARDTGLAQMTGPIILVQDAGKTPGFLFYAPFYKGGIYSSKEDRRKNFTGMVYAPFITKKLMEGTLQKDKRHVGIKIIDGNEVLYDEHSKAVEDYDPDPLFRKNMEIDIYGRTWVFDIRSDMSFRKIANNNQPLIILVGGILIDSLLLTLFILLANANQRAINFIKNVMPKDD
ncbi:CHASE domain-containing protein [Rickettsiales bacterium]|nr:CHASE domain-containing protein [Rickettsiales bacterium]